MMVFPLFRFSPAQPLTTMKKTTDRQQRIDEFSRLFALLPGPKKVDRIRQAASVMGLANENHVRRYIMTNPDRAPNWQGIRLLRAHIEKQAAA